jgi:hypothetical protein
LQEGFKPETFNKPGNRILGLPFGLYKIVRDPGNCSLNFGKLNIKKSKEKQRKAKKSIKVKCAAEPATLRARIKPYSEPLEPV